MVIAGALASAAGRAAQVDCVSFHYPPMVSRGPAGTAHGLAVDLVVAALRTQGHQVRVRLLPWGRALAMAESGQADCIFTLYRTPERMRFLDYSSAAIDSQTIYLYARAGIELAINGNVELLRRYRVGTARKVQYGERFEAARAGLQIDEASTIAQSFSKLALGRVDLVPSSGKTADAILAQPSMAPYAQRIVRLAMPIETVMSYVGFSRRSRLKGLRGQFDAGWQALEASGEQAHLLRQYAQEHETALLPPSRFH